MDKRLSKDNNSNVNTIALLIYATAFEIIWRKNNTRKLIETLIKHVSKKQCALYVTFDVYFLYFSCNQLMQLKKITRKRIVGHI
jgi:hypothetical protein